MIKDFKMDGIVNIAQSYRDGKQNHRKLLFLVSFERRARMEARLQGFVSQASQRNALESKAGNAKEQVVHDPDHECLLKFCPLLSSCLTLVLALS